MTYAKATTVLRREASKAKELLLQHALAAYQEAQSDEVLSIHEAAHCFNVPKTTLQECVNGQKSILSSNSDKSWLDGAESEVIVNKLIHSAQQGFQDTKLHLCGWVNAITQGKLGDPPFHVGENWVNQWLEKWGKWLSTHWSTSLDTFHAMGIGPQGYPWLSLEGSGDYLKAQD